MPGLLNGALAGAACAVLAFSSAAFAQTAFPLRDLPAPDRVLVAQAEALPAPADVSPWRNQVGVVLRFTLTGAASGPVWGDGVYTDDSSLAAAAVHAGLLRPGEPGAVTVQTLGPQAGFAAAVRHGISSGSYGSWGGSFRFVIDSAALPDPGTLTAYAGQSGTTLTFEVTGASSGSVWGDGVYTTDSRLARAAVHAALLQPGQSGTVTVEIMGPQGGFGASQSNGVSTSSWGPYGSSFRFVIPAGPMQ